MSISFALDYPFLIWRVIGTPEFEEGMRIAQQSLDEAEASGKRDWHLLVDLLRSTENRDESHLRNIASLIAANRHVLSGRMANLVTDPIIFGASRILGAFISEFDVHMQLFDNEPAARAWLATRQADDKD